MMFRWSFFLDGFKLQFTVIQHFIYRTEIQKGILQSEVTMTDEVPIPLNPTTKTTQNVESLTHKLR